MQCFTDKTGPNGVLFLQEIYSDSKVEKKMERRLQFFFLTESQILVAY